MKLSTVLTCLAVLGASPAIAGPAENYVKGLSGNWRGGGTVTVNEKGKRLKLRCTSKNVFNESKRTLSMRGRCASAQGVRPLRGFIRYSADGKSIASASLKLAGRGGVVSARLRGRSLILSGSGKTDDGKRVRTRSTIRGGGSRYTISLSANAGKGYRPIGTLSFSR